MKHLFKVAMLVTLVFAMALPVFAQDGGDEVAQQGVVTGRRLLAVRVAPDIQAEALKTLSPGTVVGVLEVDGLWALIYDGDTVGWTFSASLTVSDATADLTDLVQSAGVTTGRRLLAVRVAPDIQAETVATLEPETAVTVLAHDDSGLFDFVMLEDGTTGWAFSANIDAAARAYARGTVNAGPANFREGPSGDSVALNRLPFGAPVLVLGQSEDGSWLKVRSVAPIFVSGESIEGAEGWLNANLVDSDSDLSTLPVVE